MSADVDVSNPVTTDLLAARADWVDARERRRQRDSHANRVAEEAAWLDVEMALEMWDESRGDCE